MKAEYVDHMGDDLRVVNAARVSFDKESDWEQAWCEYCLELPEDSRSDTCFDERADGHCDGNYVLKPGDVKLITYLATHGHWTPFSHPQITVRETVPIFVARQRFKHMIGFTYNEVSRRYVDSEPEFFTPVSWRKRADNKKQGSAEETISGWDEIDANGDDYYFDIDFEVSKHNDASLRLYNKLLDRGVCPEQARMVLPQSMYTSYYVTGSLAAWARMYKQRVDAHAQVEIQDLAKMVGEIIEPLFPVSWKALTS